MKKIFLFLSLLISFFSYGQAEFPEGVQITGGQPTNTTPTFLTTTSPTGVQEKIPSAYIEKTANKISAITGYDTTLYPNEKATHDALNLKLNISDLPTNLTLYPTTAASDVAGYVKMVTDIHAPDYNTVAVDVSTPAITGTGQLVSQRITDLGVLIGQPGVFNVTTFGNIRRLSGSGTATFYFEVYHRDAAGVETLICTSSISNAVVNGTYQEFTASGIWNDGEFSATDRIVIKSYANRIVGGSDPIYQFQFGGTTPVRTLLPVPFSVVDAGYELKANKQNDLTIDGTGTKYPTVDAVNLNVAKIDVSKKLITAQINNTDGNLGQLVSENLIENTTFTDNFYIDISNGGLVGSGNYRTTGFLSVTGGAKYLYNRKDYGLINSIRGAWYDKNQVYISSIFLDLTNYGLFTAPSNAVYARLSYSMGTGLNNDYFYLAYKFSSYGDSITAQNKWQPTLSQYFSLYPVNVGTGGATLSGSGVGALNNDAKLAGIPSDSDIITILAGTNDWAQSIDLGTENSNDVTTFYGALNVTFKKLSVNHPNAVIIALCTTYGEYPNYDNFTNKIGVLNNLNLSTTDYANAVMIASKNHNIRFIRTDNLWDNKNISNFITFDGAYLHPNSDGGKLMASKISLDIVQDLLKLKAKENKIAIKTALTGTSNVLPKFDGLGNLVSSSVTSTSSLLTVSTDASVNGITVGRGAGNGATNTALGNFAFALNTTGGNNVALGSSSLFSAVNTSFDTAIGVQTMFSKSSGNGNVAMGYKAGRYVSGGVTNLTNSLESIYIGYESYPLGNAQANQIVIGANAVGAGSNTVTLGNTSITSTRLRGSVLGGSFVKDGGTSSQFLKADGSSDSTIYAPLSSPTFTGTPTAPTATVGTNTTQIATTAFAQGIRPYKVYTALLTQVGTDAPTAIVLENTIGAIVWSRSVIGGYFATLSGAFTTDKTSVLITNGSANSTYIHGAQVSTSNVNIITLADGQIDKATIEIRVYN